MRTFKISQRNERNRNSKNFSIQSWMITNGTSEDVFEFCDEIDGKFYWGKIPYNYIRQHALVLWSKYWVKFDTYIKSKVDLPYFLLIKGADIKNYFESQKTNKQNSLF